MGRIDGHATLTELDAVAGDLDWLDPPPFFFGASVLPLYLDDRRLTEEARPTDDVDVIVAVVASGAMQAATARIEAELRDRGWTHDTRPGRKNIHGFVAPSGVPVDIVFQSAGSMPETGAGTEDWPLRAATTPMLVPRPSGRALRVPTPAYFLAGKVAASRNPRRWDGPYDAKDVEDAALLLAGCRELTGSARAGPPGLRAFLGAWAREVLGASTAYGRTVGELLIANCPRCVAEAVIAEQLSALAELTA